MGKDKERNGGNGGSGNGSSNGRAWYGYVEGHPLTPESYYKITVEPPFGPGSRISAVFTKTDGGPYPPPFTLTLRTQIVNALALGVSQYDESGQQTVAMRPNV